MTGTGQGAGHSDHMGDTGTGGPLRRAPQGSAARGRDAPETPAGRGGVRRRAEATRPEPAQRGLPGLPAAARAQGRNLGPAHVTHGSEVAGGRWRAPGCARHSGAGHARGNTKLQERSAKGTRTRGAGAPDVPVCVPRAGLCSGVATPGPDAPHRGSETTWAPTQPRPRLGGSRRASPGVRANPAGCFTPAPAAKAGAHLPQRACTKECQSTQTHICPF